MNPSRRRWTVLPASLLLLAGCTGDPEISGEGGVEATAPPAKVLSGERVEIEFWHSMKDRNAQAIKDLIKDFKEQRPNITVKSVFQGDYNVTLARYKASVQASETPDLVQIYDLGSRYMYDSDQVVPIHKFMETDGYRQDAGIRPAIANAFTIGGKLWSMPFDTSAPLLYINEDAFKAAGLDAGNPPETLDEITQQAQVATKKGRTGFVAALRGWYLEQWTALDDAEYCDRSNGRAGTPTQVNFGTGTGPRIAQWWADLAGKGYATNTGRPAKTARDAFLSGKYAMYLDSTDALGRIEEAARFKVATAPFPKPSDQSDGGTIPGGASVWINSDGHTEAEKRASWEFVKFANSPGQQARWHEATGFVPVNPKTPITRPGFQVAVAQLQSRKPSTATAGCLMDAMPRARELSEIALAQAVPAKAGTPGQLPPEQAMRDAADRLAPSIGEDDG